MLQDQGHLALERGHSAYTHGCGLCVAMCHLGLSSIGHQLGVLGLDQQDLD